MAVAAERGQKMDEIDKVSTASLREQLLAVDDGERLLDHDWTKKAASK